MKNKQQLFYYGNSTGWDIQALKDVFFLVDHADRTDRLDPPLIVCDQRLAKVIEFSRPQYRLKRLPNRTSINLAELKSEFPQTELISFGQAALLKQEKYHLPTALCGKPFPSGSSYLSAPEDKIAHYLQQFECIAEEANKIFGIEHKILFVVTCYDKPRSDVGKTEVEQYVEGARQSLLIDDIAAICTRAQVQAMANRDSKIPVFISFQYGDLNFEKERARAASARHHCTMPISFIPGLDLNNGFLDQIACLIAMKRYATLHRTAAISLGNASTYQHLVASVGYFNRSIIALHSYPIEAAKDDRTYWLDLPRHIPGCTAFQQTKEGDWQPVVEKMVSELGIECSKTRP